MWGEKSFAGQRMKLLVDLALDAKGDPRRSWLTRSGAAKSLP
jgi:hypothetical protein